MLTFFPRRLGAAFCALAVTTLACASVPSEGFAAQEDVSKVESAKPKAGKKKNGPGRKENGPGRKNKPKDNESRAPSTSATEAKAPSSNAGGKTSSPVTAGSNAGAARETTLAASTAKPVDNSPSIVRVGTKSSSDNVRLAAQGKELDHIMRRIDRLEQKLRATENVILRRKMLSEITILDERLEAVGSRFDQLLYSTN